MSMNVLQSNKSFFIELRKTSLHQILSTLRSPPWVHHKVAPERASDGKPSVMVLMLGHCTPPTGGGSLGSTDQVNWTCYQMGAQQYQNRGRRLLGKCLYTARALLAPAQTSASLHIKSLYFYNSVGLLSVYCLFIQI